MVYDAREVGFMVRKCSSLVKRYGFRKSGFHLHHWSYKEEHALDTILLKIATHREMHGFIKLIDKGENIGFFETFNRYSLEKSGKVLDTKEKHKEYFLSLRKRRKEFFKLERI